jgi:hypothetical protein
VGVTLTIGIETMKPQTTPSTGSSLDQVYLFERDAGLLCRILGLYAARGLDVLHADYAYAAQGLMTLKVSVAGQDVATAETLRVLIDKAGSFVGVLAAAEHPGVLQRAA